MLCHGIKICKTNKAIGTPLSLTCLYGELPGLGGNLLVPLENTDPYNGLSILQPVVGLDNSSLRLSADEGTHGVRHLAVLVAQHRPAVDPAAGHDSEHTPYSTTILENDAVPVGRLSTNTFWDTRMWRLPVTSATDGWIRKTGFVELL